jgi:hypothetical protein
MTHAFQVRSIGVRWLVRTLAMFAVLGTAFGQESEHSDPVSLDDPKDWHEAYLPPPFGVIASGSVGLFGGPDEGTSFQNPLRAGIMVYYDAWQAGVELRPEATYVRIMPRSVGRDAFVAGVFELGWASMSETYNDEGQSKTVTVDQSRIGMGISARTGSSENLGARILFDATFGFATTTAEYGTGDEIYLNGQVGVLLRIPMGSFVINAGPWVGLNSGGLLKLDDGAVLTSDVLLSGGLHVEFALNLNRPQYLTGAQ